MVRIAHQAEKRPHDFEQSAERAAVTAQLDFSLFRDLKRVIDLHSEVSNGAFQLATPRRRSARRFSLVNQRGLGSAHGVDAVDSRIKPYGRNRLMDDPGVLWRRDMGRFRDAARK